MTKPEAGREYRQDEIEVAERAGDGLYAAWRYVPVSWRAPPWVYVAVELTPEKALGRALRGVRGDGGSA